MFAAVQGFRRAFAGFDRVLSGASGGAISMADTLALHFIAHSGTVTPGEIGAFTGLTSGSVTAMLDRLESAGLLVRRRNAEDRRLVVVTLRSGIQQKLAGMLIAAHGEVGRMFEGLKTDQIEDLVGLLERLRMDGRASR